MIERQSLDEGEELRTRLKWLMVLRILIVTLFLGSSVLLQIGFGRSFRAIHSFYFLIGAIYLLTILYALFINRIKGPSLELFAYFQISGDLFLETFLVFVTGGVDSPFSFMYLITVFSSGMILSKKGGILAAAFSSLLYGSLIDLQYYHAIPFLGSSALTAKETFYILFLNIMAFLVVGYASGTLSEKLKRTGDALRKKDQGLLELKGYHEHIVQSMSSGLLTTDLEGRITSFNRAAEEITGYKWEEIKGGLWWDIVRLEGLREVYTEPRGVYLPYRFDGECQRKDGTKLLLGVTISELKKKEECTGIIGIFQDLTQIREMEEEIKRREKLAMIGEMAAGMAHEIRNPLASLSGSMQVLSREPMWDEEQKTLMEIALRETGRLDNIITDFLRFARPVPPKRKACNLCDLFLETILIFKNAPEYSENIEIKFFPEEKEYITSVDPDQMKQVFWNLSINAIQAMPQGGVLSVSMRKRNGFFKGNYMRGKTLLQVLFQDSGEGIKACYMEKIFYPFFTTKNRGSGLGLAIVHRIVEDHGGNIEVKSMVGKGTTFTVSLPVDL